MDWSTTSGTTVTPSCIEDGKLVLDDDGMPENTNFYLDVKDGNAYFRGKVHATDGVFNGTVYASDGEFSGTLKAAKITGGLDALTTEDDPEAWITGCGLKIGSNSSVSNGYNFYVDPDGNVSMTGNINLSGGKITWDASNTPVQYQFSVNGTSSWHTTMTSSDKYRRDSLDGGVTWGSAYQFVGTDGSDAEVPSYIHSTYISETEIRSPTITGAKFNVVEDGAIVLYNETTSTGSIGLTDNDDGTAFVIGGSTRLVVNFPLQPGIYVKYGVTEYRVLTTQDTVVAVFG